MGGEEVDLVQKTTRYATRSYDGPKKSRGLEGSQFASQPLALPSVYREPLQSGQLTPRNITSLAHFRLDRLPLGFDTANDH